MPRQNDLPRSPPPPSEDAMQVAFMEHMMAMQAEIEETGECSIPPFTFATPEQVAQIAKDLMHRG